MRLPVHIYLIEIWNVTCLSVKEASWISFDRNCADSIGQLTLLLSIDQLFSTKYLTTGKLNIHHACVWPWLSFSWPYSPCRRCNCSSVSKNIFALTLEWRHQYHHLHSVPQQLPNYTYNESQIWVKVNMSLPMCYEQLEPQHWWKPDWWCWWLRTANRGYDTLEDANVVLEASDREETWQDISSDMEDPEVGAILHEPVPAQLFKVTTVVWPTQINHSRQCLLQWSSPLMLREEGHWFQLHRQPECLGWGHRQYLGRSVEIRMEGQRGPLANYWSCWHLRSPEGGLERMWMTQIHLTNTERKF